MMCAVAVSAHKRARSDEERQDHFDKVFRFDILFDYDIHERAEDLKILSQPYTPAATALPLTTRLAHAEAYLEDAHKRTKNYDYAEMVAEDLLANIRSLKGLHEDRVLEAWQTKKQVSKAIEEEKAANSAPASPPSAPPPLDPVQMLSGIASNIGNPQITFLLEQVAVLITNMKNEIAASPVTPPTKQELRSSHTAGNESPRADTPRDGDDLRRPRLRRKTALAEACPHVVEVPMTSDEETSATSSSGLTKNEKKKLKKKKDKEAKAQHRKELAEAKEDRRLGKAKLK